MQVVFCPLEECGEPRCCGLPGRDEDSMEFVSLEVGKELRYELPQCEDVHFSPSVPVHRLHIYCCCRWMWEGETNASTFLLWIVAIRSASTGPLHPIMLSKISWGKDHSVWRGWSLLRASAIRFRDDGILKGVMLGCDTWGEDKAWSGRGRGPVPSTWDCWSQTSPLRCRSM